MNFETKTRIVNRANERRIGISDEKGPSYTGEATSYKDEGANVLANFYLRADRGKLSVFSVAQTYAGKHVDSLETALAQLAQSEDISARVTIVNSGEGLVSRLDDLRNYCDLIECILAEEGIHPEVEDEDVLADIAKQAEARMWKPLQRGCESDTDGDGDCPACVKRGGCFFPAPEDEVWLPVSWHNACLTDNDPGDCDGS